MWIAQSFHTFLENFSFGRPQWNRGNRLYGFYEEPYLLDIENVKLSGASSLLETSCDHLPEIKICFPWNDREPESGQSY